MAHGRDAGTVSKPRKLIGPSHATGKQLNSFDGGDPREFPAYAGLQFIPLAEGFE